MSDKPRIAIIISTTRRTRFGEKPARWIQNVAAERSDMEVEIVDLREHPLPFFDEVASNQWVPSEDEGAREWQRLIASFDGYVFVTAEYNHSISAVLKNALDYAYPEWNRKPAAIVGYGSVGAARASEHLRTIAVELQMVPIRTGVHIQGADFMAAWQEGKPIAEIPYLQKNAEALLDELSWWARVLKLARERDPEAALAEAS